MSDARPFHRSIPGLYHDFASPPLPIEADRDFSTQPPDSTAIEAPPLFRLHSSF